MARKMIEGDPSKVGTFARILIVLLAYGLSFWRIVKANRGNRVIESGIAALAVLLVTAGLAGSRAPLRAPAWMLGTLGLLLFLLCLLTMFFWLQEGYRALRFRKSK